MKRAAAVFLGLFQLVFLYSVVDIYFQSPVVHGMVAVSSPQPAPALRLLLFVADGLRADRFFETDPTSGRTRVPFLRRVMEKHGAFGVSHTRVPTESRPGHVALLAGIYEDVSAVTRGWKSNPVHFDTIFNRTTASWGLGSPDIVPMFADSVPHMISLVYDAEKEDFAADANYLDQWVFDEWKRGVLENATLQKHIEAPRTMHFLHLLGIDTHGHAFRPNSRQYLSNIERVDRLIEEAHERMERRFPDGRTAYLFTSDHGMSDKGSHGAGDASETETPFVAWGAGVRGPVASSGATLNSPRNWEVDHLHRVDVEQADLTPLMATLLGIELPVNSVGKLPLSVLSRPSAEVMRRNALQVIELLRVKHELRRTSSLWFVPSPALAEATAALSQSMTSEKNETEATQLASEALETARSGLRYYDTYYRLFLYCVMSVAMAGWLLCLSSLIRGQWAQSPYWWWRPLQLSVVVSWFVLLAVDRAPFMYYVYVAFAVALASEGVVQWRAAAAHIVSLDVLVAFGVLQCLVLGFFWRPVFSLLLAGLALVAALIWRQHLWAASLMVLSGFPLLSPSFGTSSVLAVAGGAACVGVAMLQQTAWPQLALVAAATANLLLGSRVVSWSIVVASVAVPFVVAKGKGRSLFVAAAPMYILLSVAYEPVFLAVLWAVLLNWKKASAGRNGLNGLVLAYVTFFGTGNTGSLSSFEISSTYRFVTVFNPFLMSALLLVKVLLPIALVGESFLAMDDSKGSGKLVVVAMSNVIAFTFFFLVRDDGSWRDIGLSISHFVIANIQTLFALILFLAV